MNYKNAESLKALLKNYGIKHNIEARAAQTMFALESFLKKIEKSPYKEEFVLKGGIVVSSLLGIALRTTSDVDATFKSKIYDLEQLNEILDRVIQAEADQPFDFDIIKIKEVMTDDDYPGFSITLQANFENLKIPFGIDIANNALIYPEAISRLIKCNFSDETLELKTYRYENIIAEKFETLIDRGVTNTRVRDFYDIYYLLNNFDYLIENDLMMNTIYEVSKDRGTLEILSQSTEILDEIKASKYFDKLLQKYKIEHKYYTADISKDDLFNQIEKLADQFEDYQQDLEYGITMKL